MTLDEYQALCKETAVYTATNQSDGTRISYCALALVGEAGEVANVVKKAVRSSGFQGCGFSLKSSDAVRDELGDVLWYLAMMAHECGFSLDAIAQRNLEKLKARYGG